ncbi:MAG: PAS domain S-box protein [Bacteroidota bacterium]
MENDVSLALKLTVGKKLQLLRMAGRMNKKPGTVKQNESLPVTLNTVGESRVKYRDLVMNMMDGYVYVDMQGRICEANLAYQKMVGYNAEELATLTYIDLTPLKWHGYEEKIISEKILQHGYSMVYQKEYIRKDRTVFPVELHTFLVRNQSGENDGMWAIVRDITDRKNTEESLRKSEEKFRSIVESSPSAMYFYHLGEDNQLILTGANPASDLILGISHDSLLGKTIEQAFPGLATTAIPELYRKVARNEIGPQSFEIGYEDERFSGFYYVHVFRTGPKEVTVDFIDISSRRQTEEALRLSEIEYRNTLNSLPDWIYVVDHQKKITMVNTAVKEELIRSGILPGCVGQEISDAFPLISRKTIDEIKLVFDTGTVSVDEQQAELNGKTIHVEITRVPILKDDNVIKVILMIRDRSKEKEIGELKRRNTEQKEVLLREIHHRVKNNLAIVISLLNFQLRNNTSAELSRIIIDIQMRIRSMALIHEHLHRSENPDRIPLASYIESLIQMILSALPGHHLSLIKTLDPMDVSIETALPIGLIINELLTNAVKHAFPGGAHGQIHVGISKDENQVCTLLVGDNGIGLPESSAMDSEKSLGLYIIGLLTEQLDGTVTIDRTNGTLFRIRFRIILPGTPRWLQKNRS